MAFACARELAAMAAAVDDGVLFRSIIAGSLTDRALTKAAMAVTSSLHRAGEMLRTLPKLAAVSCTKCHPWNLLPRKIGIKSEKPICESHTMQFSAVHSLGFCGNAAIIALPLLAKWYTRCFGWAYSLLIAPLMLLLRDVGGVPPLLFAAEEPGEEVKGILPPPPLIPAAEASELRLLILLSRFAAPAAAVVCLLSTTMPGPSP